MALIDEKKLCTFLLAPQNPLKALFKNGFNILFIKVRVCTSICLKLQDRQFLLRKKTAFSLLFVKIPN